MDYIVKAYKDWKLHSQVSQRSTKTILITIIIMIQKINFVLFSARGELG